MDPSTRGRSRPSSQPGSRLQAILPATLAIALGSACVFAPVATTRVAQGSAAEWAPAEEGDYDLSRLPVLSEVIRVVHRNYVDPRRIDPKAMVVAAMDGVERAVGEVMSEGDPGTGKLRVTVGAAHRDFDISALKTIWDVRVILGEVMGFVQWHLVDRKNLRDVEYAAVNGMLSTLDPHTMLYDPRGYRDLRIVPTRGEAGGLGLVISMRDGNLTVLRVLKNTPAQRAGIKPKDVIAVIEERSTVNMDVQDAVELLRGAPGSQVAVSIARPGSKEPWRLQLVREIVHLETVPQAKLLEKQIGYVRVSQFATNTTRDLVGIVQQQRALAGGALHGLILDLRNNPGGLLDQAIQVSDLFLSEGVIVKAVGGDGSKVTEAHAERDDMTSLPLVVLVNNGSAAASEIVAGALKNDNRALVIGRQTFGNGSVQVLHHFPAPGRPGDNLALKLTIAQCLTPGDVSFQEVGITPDVLLVPGRALSGAVSLFAPPGSHGEADLDRHLSNPAGMALSSQETGERARAEKAALELRYLTPEQQEEEDVEANPDEVVEDFQIRFARDLLARHPYADRPRLLEAARLLVAEKRAEEESRLEQKLTQLGVDWSAAGGAAPGAPRAAVTVSPPPGKRALAGETIPWTVTVENRGDAAFHRLRAWSSAKKNPLLDRREFVFGLVKPGEKRSWTVPVKLPQGMDSRHDEVALHFEDQEGKAPPDVAASVDVAEAHKPLFAFSTQVDDDQGGNGDGNVQRGEELTLRVDVRNEGTGASGDKTYVSLKSLGDEKIFIKKGRAVVGALKPGESKTAALQLEVRRGLKGDVVPLRLMIHDEKLDEFVSEKVDLPVKADGPSRAPARGSVRVAAAQALVRAGAAGDAPPLALARRGAVLAVHGRFGDSLRVEWQKGRFGFVAASEVTSTAARPSGAAAEVWQHEPPRISLEPDPQRGAPVVEGERLHLEGRAWVPDGPGRPHLRDVFVFVNDQKVYFRAAPTPAADRIDFAADLPLKPGNNLVTVFAREDDEFQTHRSFVAYRRVPPQAAR